MLTRNEKNFAKQEIRKCVRRIQEKFRECEDTLPMDGDETENLAELFLIELDYVNGNITSSEYDDRFRELDMPTYVINPNESGGRNRRDG